MFKNFPGYLYEADKGTGSDTADATGTNGGTDKPEPKFSQADVDRIVKERLERESKKAQTAAEKAREEAEQKALADQAKYQELAEKRGKALTDKEAETADLTGRLETTAQKAERYEKALTSMLAEQRKRVPDHLHTLLDRLDPVEQLEWMAANADKLSATSGVPATPKTAAGLTDAAKEKALQDATRFYRSKF